MQYVEAEVDRIFLSVGTYFHRRYTNEKDFEIQSKKVEYFIGCWHGRHGYPTPFSNGVTPYYLRHNLPPLSAES